MQRKNVFLPVALLISAIVLLASGCSPAAKREKILQRADGYFKAGDYDRAEVEYLNALKSDPNIPRAIGQLAQIYSEQGRIGRSIAFLVKGHELLPEDLDLRIKFGQLNLAIGKLKETRDEASYVLAHRPQDPEAPLLLVAAITQEAEIEEVRTRLLALPAPAPAGAPVLTALGLLEFRQGHLPEAEATLKRALAVDPHFAAAQATLGSYYLSKNDATGAEQALRQAADASPPRSSRRLQYARFKINSGDPATGKRLLTEITQKAPDYLPAWNTLAEVALAEGKLDDCAGYIEKVLSRDIENLDTLLTRARLRMAQKDYKQAVTEFLRLTDRFPKLPLIHYELARAYLATGEASKAMDSLNRVINLAPGFAEAVILQADLNIRQGNASTAIVLLKKLLQKQPNLSNVQLLLAAAYQRQGNLEDAIAIYRQLDLATPGNSAAILSLGQVLLKQKKNAEARQAFLRVMELMPDSPTALEQLVNVDLIEKVPQQARQRVEGAIAKSPKLAGPGHLLLAKIHLAQNDQLQAEAALKKSIELQPDNSPAYYLLASLYVQTNQQEKALANLQESLKHNPKDAAALTLTGMIQDQQKNYPAAREAYEKVLATNPRSAMVLNNLAYLYFTQFGQLDKAQDLAQQARDLAPQEPHVADTLGWILYHKRLFSRALSLLEEAAARVPDSMEIQFHVGMAHYMMGSEQAAQLALQQAVQGGGFPDIDVARKALAMLAIDPNKASQDVRISLEKSLAARKDDPIVLSRLAALEEREGNLSAAIKTLESALQINDKNVNILAALARLYAAKKDPGRAMEYAKVARSLAPDDATIAYAVGQLAYQLGDHTRAASLLQEAARKLPASPDLSLDLAKAIYSIGRVTEAETALQNALAPATGSTPSLIAFKRAPEARQFLDLIALAANPAAAVKRATEVEQALKTDGDSVPALMASGAISEQKSDAGAAKHAYEKALTRFPDFAPAKVRLALLAAARPEFDQPSYDLALQARLAYPNNPELSKALGILTYRKGDFARAIVLLKESSTTRVDDAELHCYLGLAQSKVKDIASSRQSLQKSLDLGLQGNLAIEAHRVLDGLE